jgi:hypothetical protein
MYGFGEEEQGGPQGQSEQGPKWFREQMAEVSGTLKELRAENERLKENQRQEQVAKKLTAQGYAPQAAGLYTGTPDKLDDWLSANGAALAKTGGEAAAEQGQGVQGTPATVVSPESQAAMQQMASAGVDGVAAISGDDQITARMNAANTEEEFKAIMREAGNVRFR